MARSADAFVAPAVAFFPAAFPAATDFAAGAAFFAGRAALFAAAGRFAAGAAFFTALVRDAAVLEDRTGFFAAGAAFFTALVRDAAVFFEAAGLARSGEAFRATGTARLPPPLFFAAGAAFFTAVNSTSFGTAAPALHHRTGAKRPPRHSVGG